MDKIKLQEERSVQGEGKPGAGGGDASPGLKAGRAAGGGGTSHAQ